MSSIDFDERIARVQKTLHRRSSLTEIMRKTIAYCAELRTFNDAERAMATFPEFRYADQSQAAIIGILTNAGAIDQLELDKNGNIIPEQSLHSMSEDERDDAVCSYALQSTRAGMKAIEGMEPKARLQRMFSEHPERTDSYRKIMQLCKTPQTYEQVAAQLEQHPTFASENDLSTLPVYPSALLAKVEAAGGIVWNEAWILTPDGAEFLH